MCQKDVSELYFKPRRNGSRGLPAVYGAVGLWHRDCIGPITVGHRRHVGTRPTAVSPPSPALHITPTHTLNWPGSLVAVCEMRPQCQVTCPPAQQSLFPGALMCCRTQSNQGLADAEGGIRYLSRKKAAWVGRCPPKINGLGYWKSE